MFSLFRRNSDIWKKYSLILVTNCANFFSLCCFITFILLFLLFLATYILKSIDTIQVIYIDSQKPFLHKVNDRFLSIGLDDIVIAEDFKGFDMTSKKLIKMMGNLQPSYLRIGGNLADKLMFSVNENNDFKTNFYSNCNVESCNYKDGPNFTMTGTDWLKLCNLAKRSGVDIIFDLNSLIRFKNGSWDYRNAEEMIRFSNDHKLEVNWELGNEPNSYQHKFGEEVNATQLSKDFKVLKNILNKYEFYKNSLLVGPDVTRLRDTATFTFFEDFLKPGVEELDAITWHHYYLNGRIATADDFLDPQTFDTLIDYIYVASTVLKILDINNKPMWLGETSSAYGGGAPGLSDRYIGSFIWLDKLGLSAKLGIDLVVRQSIFHGNYALLDENYDPNPDWWVSILHKRILGNRVVPSYTASSPKVRLYAHCTQKEIFQKYDSKFPSITVFGMNLFNSTSLVRIEGLGNAALTQIYSFVITTDDLLSKDVYVNGKMLKLDSNNNLPKLVPKILDGRLLLKMPAYSMVFWIIPNARVAACL